MFENYSLQARRVIFLARLKAGQRGASAIEIDDLVVALIIEDQGGFAEEISTAHPKPAGHVALSHHPFLSPDLARDLLTRVEALCERAQSIPNASDMPISEGVKRAFDESARLRDHLRQPYVEPLHLLAAVLEEESNKAVQILREAGITHESVLKALQEKPRAIFQEVAKDAVIVAGPPVYSKRALQIQFLARLKARMRGSATIEMEDFLVAFLIEDQGRLLDALSKTPGIGIDMSSLPAPHQPFLPADLADELLTRVEALCSRSQPLPPQTTIPMSESVKQAFSVADLLRDVLQHDEIAPLHLLAAALETESSKVVEIFREAAITRKSILQAIRGKPAK